MNFTMNKSIFYALIRLGGGVDMGWMHASIEGQWYCNGSSVCLAVASRLNPSKLVVLLIVVGPFGLYDGQGLQDP